MDDLILKLLKNIKQTILGESVLFILRMGKREKTNSELTSSYKLIFRLFKLSNISIHLISIINKP